MSSNSNTNENAIFKLEKLAWSPVIQTTILCSGTFLCFIIAYANEDVSIYLPFISETGAHVPEMCLFSLTLIFGSVIGSVVICFRYLIVRYLLWNQDRRLVILNTSSTVIGLISMAGQAGVAAFPMSTVLWMHLAAAVIYFVCAAVYTLLQTVINHYVQKDKNLWIQLRILLCILLLILVALLVILFPMSYFKWNLLNPPTHPAAMKKPGDPVFALMLTTSCMEWIWSGSFLLYLLTFLIEFQQFDLAIHVIPIDNKT